MRKCTILNLPEVEDIVGGYGTPKYYKLKEYLVTPTVSVFANHDNTALAYYFQINRYNLEAHVESLPSARGYKLKKFLVASGKAAVREHDDVTSVMNFVDIDNKALLLFSGTFAKRVGVVGDRVLFVTERADYIRG